MVYSMVSRILTCVVIKLQCLFDCCCSKQIGGGLFVFVESLPALTAAGAWNCYGELPLLPRLVLFTLFHNCRFKFTQCKLSLHILIKCVGSISSQYSLCSQFTILTILQFCKDPRASTRPAPSNTEEKILPTFHVNH